MRKQYSIKNIKINLIYFGINSFLMFFSRKMFILGLGDELVGLSSLFQNIIGFLNITELGIANAVTFSLYKPLKNKDYKKINSILLTYKLVYQIIGLFILISSFIISLIIHKFTNTTLISLHQVRIYFILYSLSTILSYFLSYIQVLAIADQKAFIVSKIIGNFRILKIILQIIIVYLTHNYLVYIFIELFMNTLGLLVCNHKIKRTYLWIDLKINDSFKNLIEQNKNIFNDTKDLFFHKIGSFVVWQTDNLLISYFLGLKSVTLYGNYMMITKFITEVFSQTFAGLSASVGNLISEGNNERNYKLWKEFFLLNSVIAVVFSYSIFKVINLFITIWVGKEYLFDNIVIIVLIFNMFIGIQRLPTELFKNGYGIFYDKFAPLLEAVVNLVISILLIRKFGVLGVCIGTAISNIIFIVFWKPFILFKIGFKQSFIDYLKSLSSLVLLTILGLLICERLLGYIVINNVNIFSFLFYGFSVISITSIVMLLIGVLIPEFKKSFQSLVNKLLGKM